MTYAGLRYCISPDILNQEEKKHRNLPEVRKLAFRIIDACLYRILKDSLAYLHTRDLAIDPMTEKTYLYYKNYLGK